jgi:D-alanine-D-alanine ligase-like ATP-grasp enzyme
VKTVCNENRLEDNVTVTAEVGDALVADARRAVDRSGLRLAGVDVLTPDPAMALADSGGVLLEVNGTPGLSHHYHVRDRERATRVAVPVLRALLEPPVGHPSAGENGG